MENKISTLINDFERYFTMHYAQTQKQREEIFGIRYRVYCEEFGYEASTQFANQMEIDEYDDYSFHCFITHNGSGKAAGCVRLVPAVTNSIDKALPLEKYCAESLDNEAINSYHLDRNKVCEISRLAIDGSFRRRPGEAATRFGDIHFLECSKEEQRTFSLIAVSVFLSSLAVGELTGQTQGFAMMEPFLPRMLKRSGIVCQQIGKEIDYHGIRAPYFITAKTTLEGMRPEYQELYKRIYQQMKTQLN